MAEFDHPDIVGKTVKAAVAKKDDNGYDVLVITFDDGKILQVHEESQTGHFSIKVF